MPLYHPLWGIGKKVGINDLRQGALQTQTPYRDGSTHVIFEALDFIGRLAALVRSSILIRFLINPLPACLSLLRD